MGRRAGRGDDLAARGHAAGPSLLERQPAAKRQYRSIALANGFIALGQTLRYRSLFDSAYRLRDVDRSPSCLPQFVREWPGLPARPS